MACAPIQADREGAVRALQHHWAESEQVIRSGDGVQRA